MSINSRKSFLFLAALYLIVAGSVVIATSAPGSSSYLLALDLLVILATIPSFVAAGRWIGSKYAALIFGGLGILGFVASALNLVNPPTVSAVGDATVIALLTLSAYVFTTTAVTNSGLAALGTTWVLAIFLGAVTTGPAQASSFSWLAALLGLLVAAGGASLAVVYVRSFTPLLPVPMQIATGGLITLALCSVMALASGSILQAVVGLMCAVCGGYLYLRYRYDFDEMVVVVDAANRALATARKKDIHTSATPLHRAFSIFLFNESGELLLQRRATTKKTWPGIWSNSCCGHPMLNETIEDAGRRRLAYELGIRKVKIVNLVPEFSYRAEKDGIVENEICPILVAVTSETPNPNPDEVDSVRWIPWSSFVDEVNGKPEAFSPWASLETSKLVESPTFRFYLRSLRTVY